jgi:hypothetical protein
MSKSQLIKAEKLIIQLMDNYHNLASFAEFEGFETNYTQDKILVDFFIEEINEISDVIKQ